MAIFVIAIAGLPPFPSFWAKWELVLQLTRADRAGWVVLILTGSLLEAAYLFGWFANLTRSIRDAAEPPPELAAAPAVARRRRPAHRRGYAAAALSGVGDVWMFVPLMVGLVVYALDWLPGRVKGAATLCAVLIVGLWLASETTGIARLFAVLLLAGSLVIALGSLYRDDRRPGYYPLLAVLILSIVTLLRSSTSLQFFFSWEIITLSSYFLIAKGRRAGPHVLQFLLFSLASAFFAVGGLRAASPP